MTTPAISEHLDDWNMGSDLRFPATHVDCLITWQGRTDELVLLGSHFKATCSKKKKT
jgi:hypothetical protein